MVNKTWLSQYISALCATLTKLTPTVHRDMIYQCQVTICVLDLQYKLEWPVLGRKWLSLWYSAYVCDIHQIFILTRSTDCMWLLVSLTYILRLSDHDIEVVKCMYILQYLGVLHLSNLHQLFILTRSNDVILWWFVSLTSILHLRSHDQEEMIRPFA